MSASLAPGLITLRTERLILRPFTEADAPAFHALVSVVMLAVIKIFETPSGQGCCFFNNISAKQISLKQNKGPYRMLGKILIDLFN